MIFAIDMIFKVLGTNAMLFAIGLFVVFFSLDFFTNKGKETGDDSFIKQLITRDLTSDANNFPAMFVRK